MVEKPNFFKALEAAAGIMRDLNDWDWEDSRNIFELDLDYSKRLKMGIDIYVACFDKYAAPKVRKYLSDSFNALEADTASMNKGRVAQDIAEIGRMLINPLVYDPEINRQLIMALSGKVLPEIKRPYHAKARRS